MTNVNTAKTAGNPEQIITQADTNDFDETDETTSFLHSISTPTGITVQKPLTMASDDNPKQKTKKLKEKPVAAEALSTFNQHMTTGAHACVLLFVILIIYYCFSGNFEFFTWHPLLLSIGWMFLMTEAILTISKDNLFTGTLPKKVRVRLHWIFLTLAVILILSGFTVVFINKNNKNKEHFKTWHATFGLIGIVCSIPTCLDGILALYHGPLRNYISPRINKFIHIGSGVLTFTFGGSALILSVYSNWFARNSDRNIMTFILGLALATFPVIWTVIRPATTCINHLKKLMKLE